MHELTIAMRASSLHESRMDAHFIYREMAMKHLNGFSIIASVIVIPVLPFATPSASLAAGFALMEQSASGQGSAFAGAAALTEDASVIYFNPAGMTQLGRRQVVIGANIIDFSAAFTNHGSTFSSAAGGDALTGINDNGGKTAVLPNAYFASPLNEQWSWGIGINTPFGLETEYADNWVGRYHAIKSQLITINLNPALAYKVNDRLSVGAGVDAQYIDATLTSAIDFGALVGAPGALDGKAKITGDATSYGYNLGALFAVTPISHIGISYRSSIKYTLSGSADFTVPAPLVGAPFGPLTVGSNIFANTSASTHIKVPSTLSLSYNHQLNDRVNLLADITRTGWNSFNELRIKYNTLQPDSVTTEEWKNVYRYALGGSYLMHNGWKLRAGLAYDQSPVPNAIRRTPRVPDNDRTWLSVGAGGSLTRSLRLDLAYTHIFVKDASITNTFESSLPQLRHTLSGSYESSVDIVSAQLVWMM